MESKGTEAVAMTPDLVTPEPNSAGLLNFGNKIVLEEMHIQEQESQMEQLATKGLLDEDITEQISSSKVTLAVHSTDARAAEEVYVQGYEI